MLIITSSSDNTTFEAIEKFTMSADTRGIEFVQINDRESITLLAEVGVQRSIEQFSDHESVLITLSPWVIGLHQKQSVFAKTTIPYKDAENIKQVYNQLVKFAQQ